MAEVEVVTAAEVTTEIEDHVAEVEVNLQLLVAAAEVTAEVEDEAAVEGGAIR